MDNFVEIPGFAHHSNLAIFPATLKKETNVYLLSTSNQIPVKSEHNVLVEYLDNHIYCLLPSYQPTLGTIWYYKECPDFIKEFPFCMDIGTVSPPAVQPEMEIHKCNEPRPKDYDDETNEDDNEECRKCFVSHFPHPNKRLCKLKKQEPRKLWQFRLRGGAKDKREEIPLMQSLQNLEESVMPMVSRAISCANSHGINVHRGVANLANGDCAFETMIDGISTRSCFGESYQGTPEYWRKVWMEEIERIAYDNFNGGLTETQWKDGWAKLKESGAYEYTLGDLVLPGIAHCTHKDILIFNTSPLAHSPVYVVEVSTFGGSANIDIPVCLAYDQTHYESLVPDSLEDIQKTIDLKNRVLRGDYNMKIQDIPALNVQCKDKTSFSYASIVKQGNKSKEAHKSSIPRKRKVSETKFPEGTKWVDLCSLTLSDLKLIKGKDRTKDQQKRYFSLMKQAKRESLSEKEKKEQKTKDAERKKNDRSKMTQEEKKQEAAKDVKRKTNERSKINEE